jgi:hypothetical protein
MCHGSSQSLEEGWLAECGTRSGEVGLSARRIVRQEASPTASPPKAVSLIRRCCPWSPSSGKAANKDRSPCCCEPASASVGTSAGPDDASQVLHPAPQAPALQQIWSLADGETAVITSSKFRQHPKSPVESLLCLSHTFRSVCYRPAHNGGQMEKVVGNSH